MDTSFPIPEEDFFLATARNLALQGLRAEVGLLAAGKTRLYESSYDNWDGGQWGWSIDIEIDQQVYVPMTDEQRRAMETRIAAAMKEVMRGRGSHHIEQVLLVMEVPKASSDWREQAKAWVSGAGLSNQGRVRSDNLASYAHEGLLFRSRAEIHLFKALKSLGVTIAPLPVFVRGGEDYRRIEPDFILVEDGTVMVVEVDGDPFHQEKPKDAHERLAMLTREGVAPERVDSSDCETPEKAKRCAERLVGILRKHARRR
jgi:hypothetical protein